MKDSSNQISLSKMSTLGGIRWVHSDRLWRTHQNISKSLQSFDNQFMWHFECFVTHHTPCYASSIYLSADMERMCSWSHNIILQDINFMFHRFNNFKLNKTCHKLTTILSLTLKRLSGCIHLDWLPLSSL